MYICLDCGHLFEEPEIYYGQLLEHFGTPCREEWNGCPTCEGAYTTTFECCICNEYILGKYIETQNGDKICDECYIERSIDEGKEI